MPTELEQPQCALRLKAYSLRAAAFRLPALADDHPEQHALRVRLLTLLDYVRDSGHKTLLEHTLRGLTVAPAAGPVGDALLVVFKPGGSVEEALSAAEELVRAWEASTVAPSQPTDVQVGGDHYLGMAIEPRDYVKANGLGWDEGNVVKYVSRWRAKNGLQDLLKARHYLDMLIADAEAGQKS